MKEGYKDLEITEIIDKFEQGMLLSDIVRTYNFPSKETVKNIIKIYYKRHMKIGEHTIYIRIAYHDRDEIFSLHLNGNSMQKIADTYNCSRYIIKQAIEKYKNEKGIEENKKTLHKCGLDIARRTNITLEDVIKAYKTKDYSQISASAARNRLIKEFGENYVEILKPKEEAQEEHLQMLKLYEHGLKVSEIATLFNITERMLQTILKKGYEKKKIKKPRIISKVAFKVATSTGRTLADIKQEAQSQESIIPEEYIEEYVNPNDYIDINSIRRRVIEILKIRRQNRQTVNFLDSFKFAEVFKDKGYATKYQATVLLYKLIKDNQGITLQDFDIENNDVKQALETLFGTEENKEDELANTITNELELLSQKNGQEK